MKRGERERRAKGRERGENERVKERVRDGC